MSVVDCPFGLFLLSSPKIESFGDGFYYDSPFPPIWEGTCVLGGHASHQHFSNLIGQLRLTLFLNSLQHVLIELDERVAHDFTGNGFDLARPDLPQPLIEGRDALHDSRELSFLPLLIVLLPLLVLQNREGSRFLLWN